MKLKAGGWGLSLLLAAALLGSVAAQAQASPLVTTGPASYVTGTTALLNGSINTQGQPTYWQFEYGRTSQYGTTTMARLIPAGQGTVNVSARVTGLSRRSRYHFRLFMQYGQGTQYYPIFLNFGFDRKLVTGSGNLGLGTTTLRLSGRFVPVSLYCAGPVTCKDTLRITSVPKGAKQSRTLAQRPIVLGPRRTHSFTVKLSNRALSMLKPPGTTLGASLTVTPASGVNPLRAHVTLVRSP